MPDRGGGFLRGLTRLTVLVVLMAVVLHLGAGVTVDDLGGIDPGPLEDVEMPDVEPPDAVDSPDVDPPDGIGTEPGVDPPGDDQEHTVAGLERTGIEREVHERVNERRVDHRVGTLGFDEDLREVARYHSREMAEGGFFAHTSPGGEDLGDRYEQFGYDCRVPAGDGRYATGGENLYRIEFPSGAYDEEEIAEEAVEGWMNSDGHRENLLADHWQNQGIGVSITEIDDEDAVAVYVTQNFC